MWCDASYDRHPVYIPRCFVQPFVPIITQAHVVKIVVHGKGAVMLKLILVTTLFLAPLLVFVGLDLQQVAHYFERVGVGHLLLFVLLVLLSTLMRTLRYRLVLRIPIAFRTLLGILLLHQFYVTFLPMRIGEISIPLLLKQEGVRISKSIGHVIFLRVVDLMNILLWVVVLGLLFRSELSAPLAHGVEVLVSIGALLLLVIPVFILCMPHINRRIAWQTWLPMAFRQKLAPLLVSMGRVFYRQSPRTLVWVIALTTAATAFSILFIVLLAQLWIPEISWSLISMAASFGALSSILPINGLAGLGGQQVISVAMYSQMGLSAQEALAFTMAASVLVLFIIMGTGFLGAFLIYKPGPGKSILDLFKLRRASVSSKDGSTA